MCECACRRRRVNSSPTCRCRQRTPCRPPGRRQSRSGQPRVQSCFRSEPGSEPRARRRKNEDQHEEVERRRSGCRHRARGGSGRRAGAGAAAVGRVVGRRLPGCAEGGLLQAVHGEVRHQDGRRELGRRHRRAARQDAERRQQLGCGAGRKRGTGARLRGRPVRQDRLGEARRARQVPEGRGERLRRRLDRLQLRARLRRRQDQGDAEELGRLLGRQEVPGQARAAQGPEDQPRDRADRRRRAHRPTSTRCCRPRPVSTARSTSCRS